MYEAKEDKRMKVEYINPFYKATKDIFKLMLDVDPQKKDLKVIEDMIQAKETSVFLGITGDLQGGIMFSFPKTMALEMIKILSGMDLDIIDSFASSALGEIGNIIGGNALTELSKYNYKCNIIPPQIFIGEHKSLSLANKKALLLTLTTPIGDFDLSIFLKAE